MSNVNSHVKELRELDGSVIICYEGNCLALSLSTDKRKVYGDTVEKTAGNFVLVDYDSRKAFLGSTIEDCFEAWLRCRLVTDKPLQLLAVNVKQVDG